MYEICKSVDILQIVIIERNFIYNLRLFGEFMICSDFSSNLRFVVYIVKCILFWIQKGAQIRFESSNLPIKY